MAMAPTIQPLTVTTTVRPTAAATMVFVFHFIKVDLRPGSEKLESLWDWNPQEKYCNADLVKISV